MNHRWYWIIGGGLALLAIVCALSYGGRIPEETMQYLGNMSVYVLGSICLGFVIGYPLLGPGWRKTAIGFAVWFLVFSLFFVAVFIALSLALGTEFPGRPGIRLAAYVMPSLAVANLTRVMVLLQVDGYRARYEDKHTRKLI